MRTFQYLIFFECLVIIAIFLFFHENEDNRYVFEFFKTLFPRDSWVISTKYYQASKITSSLSTIFIIINTIYLIYWLIYNHKTPSGRYKTNSVYDIEIKYLILFILIFGGMILILYFKGFILLPYKKSTLIPTDSLFSSVSISILMLLFITLASICTLIGSFGLLAKAYKLFK